MSYELANVSILDILLPSSLVQYILILFYYTCIYLKRVSLVPRKSTGYPVSEQVCPAERTGNLLPCLPPCIQNYWKPTVWEVGTSHWETGGAAGRTRRGCPETWGLWMWHMSLTWFYHVSQQVSTHVHGQGIVPIEGLWPCQIPDSVHRHNHRHHRQYQMKGSCHI